MNYNRFSEKWRKKLEPYLQAEQKRNWEEVYTFYKFHKDDKAKKDNMIVLSEGVWLIIDDVVITSERFRKIRGITKNDVYYDGNYPTIYTAYAFGSLCTKFIIDRHMIDLTIIDKDKRQEALLKFIEETTGISDNTLPEVPKGILKL